MGVPETLALGGLGACFVALLWWTRRGGRRARPSPLAPELEARFEQRAIEVLATLVAGGARRLARLECELREEAPAAALAADATRLARKLTALRGGDPNAESLPHEWDYLAAATVERWPLLEPAVVDLDLSALNRVGAGGSRLRDELEPLVRRWRAALEGAESTLRADPALLWSVVDLLVLTILVVAPEPAVEAAAARHVQPRSPRPEAVAAVRDGTALALRLLETTPRHERVPHDGLPVPPLADLAVAAAVVRRRLSQAQAADELERARALVFGDPSTLWVALSVLPRQEYPAQAAVAHARLAEVARRAAAGEPPPEGVETLARDLIGAEAVAAFVATLDALRAGRTAEELFGNPAPCSAPSLRATPE